MKAPGTLKPVIASVVRKETEKAQFVFPLFPERRSPHQRESLDEFGEVFMDGKVFLSGPTFIQPFIEVKGRSQI